MECPLYLAYMLMGAICKDKTGLKLGRGDGASLQRQIAERRKERQDG